MKILATPQDDYVRTALRLPPDLHMEVKRAAAAAGHTMNAEIIARIAGAEERISFKQLLKQNRELKAMMREMLDAIDTIRR